MSRHGQTLVAQGAQESSGTDVDELVDDLHIVDVDDQPHPRGLLQHPIGGVESASVERRGAVEAERAGAHSVERRLWKLWTKDS